MVVCECDFNKNKLHINKWILETELFINSEAILLKILESLQHHHRPYAYNEPRVFFFFVTSMSESFQNFLVSARDITNFPFIHMHVPIFGLWPNTESLLKICMTRSHHQLAFYKLLV